MMTFDQVLEKNKGLGPGFDFLRIFLATFIVAFHALLLTGNNWVRDTPLWFAEYALVPMFFALSGFLVTASGMRLSLKNFLINRGLRILPALAVDITLCALIIGPIFTTMALSDYFTDQRFWLYFLNVTGYIHYFLPGVFEDHHSSQVNGALWTVPYEMICYLIISGLIITNSLKSVKKVAIFTLGLIFVGAVYVQMKKIVDVPSSLDDVIKFLLVSRESQIVSAFLFGVIAFQVRRFIPHHVAIFVICLAVCTIFAVFGHPWQIESPIRRLVLLPALTYITIFIGLTKVPMPAYFKKGDYSYGIYLYHDPILQSIIATLPFLSLASPKSAIYLLAIGLPIILLFATFSWHVIEKPILALRKKFSFVARVRGVENSELTNDPNSQAKEEPCKSPI